MGKIGTTLSLMRASWQVLRRDKELLLLPVISGICCLSVLAIFIVQGLGHGWLKSLAGQATAHDKNIAYWFVFLYYYCNYLVVIFFNSAIIACAVIRMEGGGNPTLADGIQAAANRFPHIAGWALIAATVGFLLGMLESGSRRGRSIVAAIFGIAWSVISYLAIPLIVIEKTNPLFALERSHELMRKTWGEQVIGNFSFGLIFALFSLPVFPLMLILQKTWGSPSLLPFISLTIIYLVILGIFQSALQTIFNAVIYVFARDGRAPEGFSADQLHEAMRRL